MLAGCGILRLTECQLLHVLSHPIDRLADRR